jgi:hypothetical protein
MDIAFIGRLTKVDYILHNAPTSRVRNPGPDLGQAQQRGEVIPYNGINLNAISSTTVDKNTTYLQNKTSAIGSR